MSRSQPSTSATKSSSSVVPASPGTSKAATIRAASVPPSEAKDDPIPPPANVKKGPACRREKPYQPPSKASSRTKVDSGKVPTATSMVGKGHKGKGKSAQGTEPPGEGLVSPLLQDKPATCTAVGTTTMTATCTASCTSAASTTVTSIIPSGHPSETAGDGLVSPSTSADTCTTGSISTAATATATATCPVTCRASATTVDISSIPNGQPSKAAGDILDPAHTT
ncbi:hypothetical protein NDU88_000317 [Pleurodeles waltl]|uniref:Uncharacterized protein n=1 Tax=Pleurodeles waltl TaxID=8319 RepID=A0AAV7UPN2_PLEWA|nr:hypothetical protein NDU88_000317 [Pleurodeles waltl]